MSRFPREIEDLGNLFVDLQIDRHSADYDPFSRFNRADVIANIDAAENAIKAFRKTQMKDKRAFAAWTAMKSRI